MHILGACLHLVLLVGHGRIQSSLLTHLWEVLQDWFEFDPPLTSLFLLSRAVGISYSSQLSSGPDNLEWVRSQPCGGIIWHTLGHFASQLMRRDCCTLHKTLRNLWEIASCHMGSQWRCSFRLSVGFLLRLSRPEVLGFLNMNHLEHWLEFFLLFNWIIQVA